VVLTTHPLGQFSPVMGLLYLYLTIASYVVFDAIVFFMSSSYVHKIKLHLLVRINSVALTLTLPLFRPMFLYQGSVEHV
jgi:hypothetical protein